MTNAFTFIIYVALTIMPPTLTFGLPNCSGSITGLTERYDPATETIYVDECHNGVITDPNLPVIDMTTSVVVIMTSEGRVTIQLPRSLDRAPFSTASATVQSSDVPSDQDERFQDSPAPKGNCDAAKLFLDDCLMGPRP